MENDQKKCTKCKQTKNLSEFSHYSGKDSHKLRSHCKKCCVGAIVAYQKKNPTYRKEQAAQWYKNNPEEAKGRRLKKYWPGSTWQEALANYNKMHTDQNGLCLFCRQPETTADKYGGIKSLAVDHNHTTKKVRGLLCYSCNSAFGNIKENVEAIQNMLDYAKKHHESETKCLQPGGTDDRSDSHPHSK